MYDPSHFVDIDVLNVPEEQAMKFLKQYISKFLRNSRETLQKEYENSIDEWHKSRYQAHKQELLSQSMDAKELHKEENEVELDSRTRTARSMHTKSPVFP